MSSKKNNVKIITFSGSTTEDMLAYNKPISRKKSDTLIIHTGANDLTKSVNAVTKIRKLVKVVRELDISEKNKIRFSSFVYRKEKTLRMNETR